MTPPEEAQRLGTARAWPAPARRWLEGLGRVVLWCVTGLWCLSAVAADRVVETASGEPLEVRVTAGHGPGPLFVWLDNQYAETRRPREIATQLAATGATVWQVDLLDSLFLERTAEAIRGIDGEPVADLIDAALASGLSPVVLVACDRMAAPALRGMRAWQQRAPDPALVAGAILFFPNLYRGTPIAGEPPELLGIVSATNMPVMIVQPALGANRSRLGELVASLRTGGGQVYTMIIDAVRDYYLLRTDRPESEDFGAMRGPVPPEIELAIAQTPERMLAAARLLALGPRPEAPVDIQLDEDQPVLPAYGLIERQALSAPDFALDDARGQPHRLADSLGRVTLVNFWATWCPPCVHEIPSMNRLAGAYDPADFAIVSINFKESPAHILAFMERVAVDFPVLMDADGRVSGQWGVFAFPSSFILDHAGRVRYSVNTAIEWDAEEVHRVIDLLLEERQDAVAGIMLDEELAEIVRDPRIGLYKAYAEFKMANYARAREFWQALAGRGVAEAWFNLGILAEDGLGEAVDAQQAIRLYHRGAEGGSEKAQFRLAQVYLEGRLVEPDRVQAERWLRAAADAGYEDAAAQLSQLALGVKSNDYLSARMLESEGRLADAASIYARLSDAGNLRARTRLAWLYEAGRGLERDLERAAELFRSAAEAGDAEAQFALGVMLKTGAGQQMDADEALYWLRRSASQGYPEARRAIEEAR